MLLIDGIKYELWDPPSEDDFEQMVKDHTQEIFGEQSIYIDRKQKLKSLSGVGSIPDGYVICFGDSPHWHIVEMELSSHPLHDHIVSQVSRFITGIGNTNNQRMIVNALDEKIGEDDFIRLKSRKGIEPTETHRFLSDLIARPPILTIIIEEDTEELREALSTLNHSQIKVIEFQTFRGDIDASVHAHLFEPMEAELGDTTKEFLRVLRQETKKRMPELDVGRPSAGYCKVETGHKDIHLECLSWGGDWLGVELHLEGTSRDDNLRVFRKLESIKKELEKNIGQRLKFEDEWKGHKKWSRIYVLNRQEGMTSELKEWAIDTMTKFYEVFKPLLDEMEL